MSNPIIIASLYDPSDDLFKSDKTLFVKQAYMNADKISKRMSFNFIDNVKNIKVLGLNSNYTIGQEKVYINMTSIRLIYKNVLYHVPSINIQVDKNVYQDQICYLTITAVTNNQDVTFTVSVMTIQDYITLSDANTSILAIITTSNVVYDMYVTEDTSVPVETTPKHSFTQHVYTYRVFMNGINLVENIDYRLKINTV